MNEPWRNYAKGKQPVRKDHIVYDYIYMKYPEWVNSQKQNADQFFPMD